MQATPQPVRADARKRDVVTLTFCGQQTHAKTRLLIRRRILCFIRIRWIAHVAGTAGRIMKRKAPEILQTRHPLRHRTQLFMLTLRTSFRLSYA